MNQLSERYATALFELAKESKSVKEWQTQAQGINEALTKDMDKFFSSNLVSADEKKQVLKKAFGQVVVSELMNFLCLLIDKKRFAYIKDILVAFNTICNHDLGIMEGVVYSARPLTNEQVKTLEQVMCTKYNSTVQLINRIDARLISGVKVEINGTVIDYSMKNKIASLRNELLKEMR